jgi:hypothetical protein
MDLRSIESFLLDHRIKGVPGGIEPFTISRIGEKRWNVLREDLPLPLAILKESALAHNGTWMRRFLGLSGAVIAPHGKTTMSPQLFARQFAEGPGALPWLLHSSYRWRAISVCRGSCLRINWSDAKRFGTSYPSLSAILDLIFIVSSTLRRTPQPWLLRRERRDSTGPSRCSLKAAMPVAVPAAAISVLHWP